MLMQWLETEFGLGAAAAQLIWFVVFALVGATVLRVFLYALNVTVKNWAYWIAAPLVVVLIAIFTSDPRSSGADFSRSTIYAVSVGEIAAIVAGVDKSFLGSAGVTVHLQLRNVGEPSSIDSAAVTFMSASKTVVGCVDVPSPLLGREEGPDVRVHTMGLPSALVDRGRSVRVVLACVLQNVSPDEARRAGSEFKVTFTDAFGRPYEVKTVMSGVNAPF
jgi:hypothetical protein